MCNWDIPRDALSNYYDPKTWTIAIKRLHSKNSPWKVAHAHTHTHAHPRTHARTHALASTGCIHHLGSLTVQSFAILSSHSLSIARQSRQITLNTIIINHHQPSSTIINHHQPSSIIIDHHQHKVSVWLLERDQIRSWALLFQFVFKDPSLAGIGTCLGSLIYFGRWYSPWFQDQHVSSLAKSMILWGCGVIIWVAWIRYVHWSLWTWYWYILSPTQPSLLDFHCPIIVIEVILRRSSWIHPVYVVFVNDETQLNYSFFMLYHHVAILWIILTWTRDRYIPIMKT